MKTKSTIINNEITITQSVPDDLNEITELFFQTLTEWNKKINSVPEELTELLKKQVEHNLIITAKKKQKIIGFIAYIDNTISCKIEKTRIHITNTYVIPAHRRSGVGSMLRKFLIEHCKRTGKKRITTNHHHSNLAIIELSTKMGFTIYSEHKLSEQCGDSIFMELLL